MPTNRCNANCKWCCYADVDKQVELSIEEIKEIILYFFALGTRAITFSGGGEPTVHPHIDDMLSFAKDKGISCGLVTNGLKWSKKNLKLDVANKTLTWARMSIIETIGDYDIKKISRFANNLSNVDIGISFVVPDDVNIQLAIDICNLVKGISNITHIKFIQDSYNLNSNAIKEVEIACNKITNKAFFVPRTDYTKGQQKCQISLLKPVVNATGYIFPCCDIQHAAGDFKHPPKNLRMCYWNEFHKAEYFNGSKCTKCYYDNYNLFLNNLLSKVEHINFL